MTHKDLVTPLQGDADIVTYKVTKRRWVTLAMFVIYSASNAMQWTQYTVIMDVIVRYYGVSNNSVSWTSMVYMITYIPLIFPASWLLNKMLVSKDEIYNALACSYNQQLTATIGGHYTRQIRNIDRSDEILSLNSN